MTREEAVRILAPETTRDALWEYESSEERFAAVNEACRLGAEALRGALTTMEGTYVSMAWFETETKRLKEELQKARAEAGEGNILLTLPELLEMDGEPVWVVDPDGEMPSCWMLVNAYRRCAEDFIHTVYFDDYGVEWAAYRRRPEEGV